MNEYRYDEIETGLSASFVREVTPEMERLFRAISGDDNPLHRDDAFAQSVGGGGRFPRHVSFGMLTASLYSTLAGMYLPGRFSLIHSMEIKFQKPVFAGDVLTVRGVVKDKEDGLRLILVGARIDNQAGICVSRASMKVLVLE